MLWSIPGFFFIFTPLKTLMKLNRKIAIILLLVVFLPAIFFSVYEIGSLNENEKIFEKTYNNQLEAILFSVNQFSEGVASSWVEKMNIFFANPNQNLNTSLKQFILGNPAIKGVFYTTDTTDNKLAVVSQDGFISKTSLIENLLHNNAKKINRLYYYLAIKYRKVEVFSSPKTNDLSYFVFLADNYRGKKVLCGIGVVFADQFR